MRVGLIDCSEPRNVPRRTPHHPSPSLLLAGGALAQEGHAVSYVGSDAPAGLELDRVLLLVPPWREKVAAERAAQFAGRAEVVRLEPWRAPPVGLPAYALAREECHGEVDLAPGPAPVHPWVTPSLSTVAAGEAEERLRAAFAGLAGVRNAAVVLGDERIALDNQRLHFIAELVSKALRDRKSLVNLHLRVWPHDLAREGLVDNLSLLPVAGLELLVGSLHEPSLRKKESALGPAELAELVATLAKAGLAPVTTLSIVAGLPGESVQESIAGLNRALELAAAHKVAAIRLALWLGEPAPPTDPVTQKQRFLASHPSWSEAEYRGIHDLVAVVRQVATGIALVGPGFLPEWDEVP